MRPLPFFLLCLLLFPVATAHADVLKIPHPESGKPAFEMPQRGMTAQQVAARFGQPAKKMPAVGDPPIIRWIYDGYSVYFEGKYVIHSVPNRK